jgi:hypothetical protein
VLSADVAIAIILAWTETHSRVAAPGLGTYIHGAIGRGALVAGLCVPSEIFLQCEAEGKTVGDVAFEGSGVLVAVFPGRSVRNVFSAARRALTGACPFEGRICCMFRKCVLVWDGLERRAADHRWRTKSRYELEAMSRIGCWLQLYFVVQNQDSAQVKAVSMSQLAAYDLNRPAAKG